MFRTRAAGFVLLLLVARDDSKPLAQSATGSAERQSFNATATAILVDVVVRDHQGHPVTDLAAKDFSLAEDGVQQQIDTFTRVSRGSGIGLDIGWRTPANTTSISSSDGDAFASPAAVEQATTALVFDHLSAESLRLAQKATLDFVPKSGESSARVAVFATDPGVRIVQPFTTDRTRIRQAVERVMPAGTAALDQKADRTDELIDRRRELVGETRTAAAGAPTSTGAAASRLASEIGVRETELQLVRTELNMIRSFDNLDRGHKGYDTSVTLFAVVQALANYPGRKTIVFFSEGLPVTPALSARLDSVIDAANRTNVTTYAIDAKGLRSKSAMGNVRKEMDAFAEERLNQVTGGSDRTDQPLTMAFERVEDTLKLDSRTGLARLARETGGFLVEQTNDLSSAFRRIDEDNRFHYLLTYSPKNTDFDGKFRAIQVKVHRSGMEVFARKGYRAIRTAPSVAGDSYEMPATALLARTPLPNAFPIQAAGFSFPDPARPGLTPVLVRVRTDALRFAVDAQRASYQAQAAIVVRLLDGQRREVQKLSQQYLLSGDANDVEAARRGEILFYRDPDLAPGVYIMEAIVFDAIAGRGSARVTTLTVPPANPSALGMSSLVLVSRAEDVPDVPESAATVPAPLYVGHILLYPNLGEPILRSATTELPFYFTLYGEIRDVKIFAQLLRNGEPVAEAPVHAPPPISARMQHVGRLPIGSLPAGTYELRIRVSDGRQELSRTSFFTLQ